MRRWTIPTFAVIGLLLIAGLAIAAWRSPIPATAAISGTVAPAPLAFAAADAAAPADASAVTYYTCPMHPEVKQDKPGSCPECGMTLVPVKK